MAEHRHFLLQNTRTEYGYTSTIRGGDKKDSPPRPERKTHAEKLLSDLERAEKKAKDRQKKEPARDGLQFIPMLFDESSDFDLEFQQLENTSPGIRIVSAKECNGRKEYLVAVPDSEVSRLVKKFQVYQDSSLWDPETSKGKRTYEKLASSIADIDAAELEDYWTGASETLPKADESLWWEVWLDTSGTEENVETWFRETAASQKINVSSQQVKFPDRVVILGYASFSQWRSFPGLLRFLAELRKAAIVAGEFTSLPSADQADFINGLLRRTTFADDDAVRVCVLDTGVNRGHPLLEESLREQHMQTWDANWGSDDHNGHGTEMAGVCLFGPLGEPLYSDEQVNLLHRLESIKILPRTGNNDPPDYGPITVGSMALAEMVSPKSQRVFCMAVCKPHAEETSRQVRFAGSTSYFGMAFPRERLPPAWQSL